MKITIEGDVNTVTIHNNTDGFVELELTLEGLPEFSHIDEGSFFACTCPKGSAQRELLHRTPIDCVKTKSRKKRDLKSKP